MMKNVSLTSTLARVSKLTAFAVMLAVAAPAMAADKDAKPAAAATGEKSGSIAVVDLQFLVANSKAGKSIRDQLDKQRASYRTQLDKQEKDLRTAEQNLMGQKEKLSKEDFMKKGKEFQDKVVNAQRDVQKRRVAFDKAYATAMEKLREHVVKIVADIAGKNNVSLVLNRQEVVLVDAKMDITKQVLTALDGQVTSIPVSVK